ncbi:hypothetical protein I6B53_01335 [Schaalia sp. 19OD2882]|uniref:hypothetical protein n=1 Tax=Schaalia sp. 19OD2882 TaxID=2794089 RepID=UPI001C1F0C8F|nr:hypothetical protein [Schaalia sp. 19OD2882]QWW19806.1 hypothetical protein I6B53_01335 [Schaalia sp. 19OD2882]
MQRSDAFSSDGPLRRRHGAGHASAQQPGPERARAALTGPFLSALVVIVLVMAGAVASVLPHFSWSITALVCLATIVLARGWPALTRTPVHLPGQVGIVLVGAATALSVAASRDLWSASQAMGLSLLVLIGIEVLTAPRPTDHSLAGGEGEAAPWGRRRGLLREPATGDGEAERQVGTWATSSTTAAIASSMTGALLASGGAAWVWLASSSQWRGFVPVAGIVVACVVAADQVGATYRIQSLMAVATSLVAGAGSAVGLWLWGGATGTLPVLLPILAGNAPSMCAALLLGATAGLAVALVVIVVDGLLGAHAGPHPPRAHVTRGIVKFLVAALPLYVLVHIGGV